MENNNPGPFDNSWKDAPQQQKYNQYPPQGYGQPGYGYGYDAQGFDPQGYDMEGYDRQGYDRQGYDRNGFDRNGYDRYGNPYNQYNHYNPYNQYPNYQDNANYGVEPEPHMVKAVFAMILCFPFGIPALINACRVKALSSTDVDSALEASHNANKWGNIGIIVGIIVNVLYFFLTLCHRSNSYGYSPYEDLFF